MIGGICSSMLHQARPPDHSLHVRSGRRFHGRTENRQALHYQAETRQSADLSVVTADGDTVSISIQGLQRLQLDSLSARKVGSQMSYISTGAESRLDVSLDVEGSLDAEEVADINHLMQQLAGIVEDVQSTSGSGPTKLTSTSVPDSLLGYDFAYTEQSEVAWTTVGSMTN